MLMISSTLVVCWTGMWQWRPITEVVWQLDDPKLALAVQAISFLGWGIVLLSTFLINHFEL
jgi:methanethiol S-methyltransferase